MKSFTGDNNPISSFSWMTKVTTDLWGLSTGQNGVHQAMSNIGLYRTITQLIPDSEE